MNKDEFSKPAGGGRKIFLVVVLLLVLGALGYDFLVAKPAYEGGMAQLQSLQEKKKGPDGELIFNDGKTVSVGDLDGDGHITPEDVHQSMGREPASTSTPVDSTLIEVYTWPRGIPFVTYKAYVIYSRGDDATELYKVTEREPNEQDYRQRAQTLEDRPPGLTRSAGGGPGGGGQGKTDDDKTDEGKGDDEGADDEGADDDMADEEPAGDDADTGDDGGDDAGGDDAGGDDSGGDEDSADDGGGNRP